MQLGLHVDINTKWDSLKKKKDLFFYLYFFSFFLMFSSPLFYHFPFFSSIHFFAGYPKYTPLILDNSDHLSFYSIGNVIKFADIREGKLLRNSVRNDCKSALSLGRVWFTLYREECSLPQSYDLTILAYFGSKETHFFHRLKPMALRKFLHQTIPNFDFSNYFFKTLKLIITAEYE